MKSIHVWGCIVFLLLIHPALAIDAENEEHVAVQAQSCVLNGENTTVVPIAPPTTSISELDEILWIEDWEGDTDSWVFSYLIPPAPVYWDTSAYSPEEGYNWRCYDQYIGPNGGYDDVWLQWLVLPVQDLTATTNPELSFSFRLQCQPPEGAEDPYDAFDGANVWIYYGEQQQEREVIQPTTGAEYNATSLASFGETFDMGDGIPGWTGMDFSEWTDVTFDLSEYSGHDDAYLVIAFSSDQFVCGWGNDDYTGFQVDNIVLQDDNSVLFEDDAEDREGTDITLGAGNSPFTVIAWEIIDGVSNAPSPDHVLGNDTYGFDFRQAYDYTGWIQLPDQLDPGESLFLDFMLQGDLNSENGLPLDERPYWTVKIYVESDGTWYYGNNVRGHSGVNYVYVDAPGTWSSFDDMYYSNFDLSPALGERIQVRFDFYGPPRTGENEYEFTHLYIDDVVVEHSGVEHDLEISDFFIGYPATINFCVPNLVTIHNRGTNTEDFNALWFDNGQPILLYPAPPYHLDAGESLDLHLDYYGDEVEGEWIPTTAGEHTVRVRHLLADDQVPETDDVEKDVFVLTENMFEFGYDDRTPVYFVRCTEGETSVGPMVHYTPEVDNPEFENYGFNLRQLIYYWFMPEDEDWPDEDPLIIYHVFAGGDTPGEELWSGSEVIGYRPNGTVYFNSYNTASVPELQGIESDFWVWVELVDLGIGGYAVPYPVGSEISRFPDNQFIYEESVLFEADYDAFVHVMAQGYEVAVDDDEQDALPGEFAIQSIYPNPFNPVTTIHYSLPELSHVKLTVFDLLGREVTTLVNGELQPGQYSAVFDGTNMASGLYFVQMQAGDFSAIERMVLMK